jgi:hypothetical protein
MEIQEDHQAGQREGGPDLGNTCDQQQDRSRGGGTGTHQACPGPWAEHGREEGGAKVRGVRGRVHVELRGGEQQAIRAGSEAEHPHQPPGAGARPPGPGSDHGPGHRAAEGAHAGEESQSEASEQRAERAEQASPILVGAGDRREDSDGQDAQGGAPEVRLLHGRRAGAADRCCQGRTRLAGGDHPGSGGGVTDGGAACAGVGRHRPQGADAHGHALGLAGADRISERPEGAEGAVDRTGGCRPEGSPSPCGGSWSSAGKTASGGPS